MFTRLTHSMLGRAVAIFLMCLLPVAQALELGALSMVHVPSKPLASVAFSHSPATFTRFARAVGGVAFTTTATSTDGSTILGVAYNPQAPDGSRMRVHVRTAGGKDVWVPLDAPDWIHVPLARFVATDAEGAVTLFGELQDAQQERVLREQQKAMIASYHPALENTLLGLRLLQADMLVIEQNATDVFKDKGQYILGAGESPPTQQDLQRNHASFQMIRNWIMKQPEKFESYVSGDVGAKVRYSLVDGKLKLSGTPTWYCWKSNKTKNDQVISGLVEKLSPDAYAVYVLNEMDNRMEAAAKRMVPGLDKMAEEEQLKAFLKVQPKLEREVVMSTARDILAHSTPPEELEILDRKELLQAHASGNIRRLEQLFGGTRQRFAEMKTKDPKRRDMIMAEFKTVGEHLGPELEKINVIQMKKYSNALSAEVRKAGGINPLVFDALQRSVHVAALLRAAKANNPTAYRQYVASIAKVGLKFTSPAANYALKTPTVYPRLGG